MVLNKMDKLESYATYLRSTTVELDALYSDVLISVTSFSRNPEAFDVLQRLVFPKLIRQRGDDPFRIWVLGCSTGQEAYSIAMAFMESAEQAPRMRKLQVFATDLNDALLDKARHGLYSKTLVQDLSPERLRRFFIEEDGGYRVNKMLREMAERLRALKLGLRVLFMSAYIENNVVQQSMESSAMNFLLKPFSIVALAQKVRQLLDQE